MNAAGIRAMLHAWTVDNSGFEDRSYLGMSRIAECSRVLYEEMVNGREWDAEHHMRCYLGYLFERDIKRRLQALGLYVPGSERELVAAWDDRFRGHTDGGIVDGALLEIKSTVQAQLDRVKRDRRVPRHHFLQVQTYMHHGGFDRAVVVYVARDTGGLWVEEVPAIPPVARRCDDKAQRVLRAVDRREPPPCECGRCR